MPNRRSKPAIIYRSPTGAVAVYSRCGELLIFVWQKNSLSMACWREYSGIIPAFDNAEWMTRTNNEKTDV